MIGLQFIVRLLTVSFYAMVALALLFLALTILNLFVMGVAKILGFQVGWFWDWVKPKFKAFARKFKRRK